MSDRTFPAPSTISEQTQQWLSFQAPPSQYPPTEDVDAWVAMVDQSNAYITQQFLTAELPVDVETITVDGVTVYAIRPHGVEARDGEPIYIDIHGGGLLMGGGEACRIMSSMAALSAGMLTWGVDYRMPPLHPYPAALDDVMAVYRTVITDHDPSKVFVGGGSAGGNLAAALTLRAKDEGLPLPAALVLNTPEIDLTESGDTFQTLEGVDNVLHSLKVVNDLYANGADLTDPYLSPIFGDVTGFPPTFLQSGTRDLFLSNTVRMHRKLRAAGVDAELHVFEAMPHGGFGSQSPEDREHAAEQRRFLVKHGA